MKTTAMLVRFITLSILFFAANAAAQIIEAGNQAPRATITSPGSGTRFNVPVTIVFTADAFDPDGSVAKVEYFNGRTSLGFSTTSPYAVPWPNVPVGTYSITAKATDLAGKTGVASPAVQVIVISPTTVIQSPAVNAVVSTGSVFVSGTYTGDPATTSVIVTGSGGHSTFATLSGNNFSASVPVASGASNIEVQVARADGTAEAVLRPITGSVAPIVALVVPASCPVLNGPVTITVTADAATEQGSINGVDFFDGTTPIGSAGAPPYTITPTLAVGTHRIRARATNSFTLTADTPEFVVTVQSSNAPPFVELTAPADGASFTLPQSIIFTANASDSDGISLVEFLANDEVVGSASAPPYQFTWTPPQAITYRLQARAHDTLDGISTSSPAHIVTVNAAPPNQPPTIAITAPADNANIDMGTDVTIVASAADPDGNVQNVQVQFFAEGTLIDSSAGATPSAIWRNVLPGTYRLTAVATDERGGSTTSPAITVRVGVHVDPGETIVYLHNDFAGNPIAGTDTTGAVIWKENYRPFGGRLVNAAAAQDNRQWFAGKAADSETGLSYFGARYYDSTLGRFMGVDSANFSEDKIHSFNRFSYGNNNPYRHIDPDGNSPLDLAFLAFDLYQLGTAIYAGEGVGGALAEVGISVVGVLSPVPGTGVAIKAARAADKAVEVARTAEHVAAETGFIAKEIQISRAKYGEAATHIEDAQRAGHPSVLTVEKGGADANRSAALAGREKVPGKQLDEYPPAMFKEGGAGASVRPINPSNNMGAGACIGNQCRSLSDGSKVKITVVD